MNELETFPEPVNPPFMQAALRFPLSLLAAVIGTWAAFRISSQNSWGTLNAAFLNKLVIFSWLGLILFFVLQLLSERYKLVSHRKWLIQGLGGVVLTGVFLLLPEKLTQGQLLRLFLVGLGLHLVSSFAPFFNTRNEHRFWQFNERLFIRILTAGLYTTVLFAGISLAFLAADQLFSLRISPRVYLFLWLFLAGIFNTWFFLAGVPSNYEALESEKHYPKGLKIFTQFVLLPLVTVYLIILYMYLVKILVHWDWPQGWVSNLILGFSVVGILSLLLVHPIRNQEGNTWIKTFTKWFYLAIVPLLILFSLAIWRRVSEYGITEMRYFVLLLAFWLLLVTVYFLTSRQKNIKFIPVTLSLLVFISAVGPLNAFAISEFSQVNRLKKLLEQNNMLAKGKLKPPLKPLNTKDRIEITRIFTYLNQKHSLEKVKPWVPDTVKLLQPAFAGRSSSDAYDLNTIYHYLGLDKPWITEAPATPASPPPKVPLKEQQYFEFRYLNKGLARTTGYDFHTTFQFNPSYDTPRIFEIGEDTLSVERVKENNSSKSRLLFWLNATDSVSVPIKPMVQRILDKNITEPAEADLSETVILKKLEIKIVFDQISGSISKGKAYPHDYMIRLLIRLPSSSSSGTGG